MLLPNDVITTLNVEVKCYCDETPIAMKDNDSAENGAASNQMDTEIIENQHSADIEESSKSQDLSSSELDQVNSDQKVDEENSKSHDSNPLNKDPSDQVISEKGKKQYSYQDLKDSWRRFSIDLLPKVIIYSSSIIQSWMARKLIH